MDRDFIDEILKVLKEKEYKSTPQRRVILEIFARHQDEHLSADDVFALLREKNPEVGLATVYRTLDLFEELGIIEKLNFGDGKYRYEICVQDDHHHHHLICLTCGKVTEFEDDLLESLEAMIQKKNQFKILDHQLKFYGHCSACYTE